MDMIEVTTLNHENKGLAQETSCRVVYGWFGISTMWTGKARAAT